MMDMSSQANVFPMVAFFPPLLPLPRTYNNNNNNNALRSATTGHRPERHVKMDKKKSPSSKKTTTMDRRRWFKVMMGKRSTKVMDLTKMGDKPCS